jgi:hypothetical protein
MGVLVTSDGGTVLAEDNFKGGVTVDKHNGTTERAVFDHGGMPQREWRNDDWNGNPLVGVDNESQTKLEVVSTPPWTPKARTAWKIRYGT